MGNDARFLDRELDAPVLPNPNEEGSDSSSSSYAAAAADDSETTSGEALQELPESGSSSDTD
eukprot:12066727-Prorocentrum_lima.AAC.1